MNIPIWPGTSTFATGQTPFGFYDSDTEFAADADKVSDFCARRLGYPLADVELQSGSFYTAFEEAVTTYGNELCAYKVRENLLSLEGFSTSSVANKKKMVPNQANIVSISEQYGTEAGVGGSVTYYTGSLNLILNQQKYDLNAWAAASASLDAGDSIEIKRIFYYIPPAITRYFDPYAGTGTGLINLMDSFGFGSYSPAINFLLMPINYDIQTIQAIEFNDMVRRSQYSFELVNNQLKIFPIPKYGNRSGDHKLWFEYIKKSERNNPYSSATGVITNVSNVPFENPTYKEINSIGRQWIFEYLSLIHI